MIGIVAPFNPYSVYDFLDSISQSKVPRINQTASSINNLVVSLLREGEKVCVFTLSFQTSETIILYGESVIVYVVGSKQSFFLFNYFPDLYKLSRKLAFYINIERNKIRVLHSHWTYEYAMACSTFVNIVPVLCTVRDWASYIYKSISITPFYLFVIQKIYWAYKMKIAREILNNDQILIICNSIYTKSQVLRCYPDRKVELIPNSIDERLILDQKKEISSPVFISISSSLDDKRKNLGKLIEAFALVKSRYSNSQLVLVGNYHKNRCVYKKVVSLDLFDSVVFKGVLDKDQLIDVIDSSTCLVHPSLEETFGNILLEAMVRRIPVIGGKDSGAVPYVLKGGTCGCICDVTSSEKIAAAMERVIEDTQYSQNLVLNSINMIKSEYTNEIVAKKHIELYHNIVK